MGFLKKLFGGKQEVAKEEVASSRVSSLDNNGVINLKKNDEKITISLSKKNVSNLTAEVKLILDRSGSMNRMYNDGTVQRVLEKLASLAFRFDDNGRMESLFFNSSFKEMPDVTTSNLFSYGKDNDFKNMACGGTNYAPPIKEIVRQAKNGEFTFPAFVIFITDGSCFDEEATRAAIREASNYDIYFQFVGIGGNDDFDFLKSLDNLSGRKFDNAGFIEIANIGRISDEDLYDQLLDEFVDNCKNGTLKGANVQKIDLSKK